MNNIKKLVLIFLIVFMIPFVVISCNGKTETQKSFPQEEALRDSIFSSIKLTEEGLTFQIPSDYSNLEWSIWISGRAEFDDDFSTSLHYLTEESENKTWEINKWYVIELTQQQIENVTELEMTVSWFRGDGVGFTSGVSLMPYYEIEIDDA